MRPKELRGAALQPSPVTRLNNHAVWEVLEGLRQLAFSGEVRLDTEPPVQLFLTRGHVYIAENNEQSELHDRLLADGSLHRSQLVRGSLTVGGRLHLGRLFDRDPSIDRDLVELSVDCANNDVLGSVAEQIVRSIDARPLRHHPAGVHLWSEQSPASGRLTIGNATMHLGSMPSTSVPQFESTTELAMTLSRIIDVDDDVSDSNNVNESDGAVTTAVLATDTSPANAPPADAPPAHALAVEVVAPEAPADDPLAVDSLAVGFSAVDEPALSTPAAASLGWDPPNATPEPVWPATDDPKPLASPLDAAYLDAGYLDAGMSWSDTSATAVTSELTISDYATPISTQQASVAPEIWNVVDMLTSEPEAVIDDRELESAGGKRSWFKGRS